MPNLMAKKAQIECTAKSGKTPLHASAAYGKDEAVEYLISKGARVNTADNDGSTPLHHAAGNAIVSLLIKNGARNEDIDRSGKTPLHDAVVKEQFEVVKYLVAKGLRFSPPPRVAEGPWVRLQCTATSTS